MNASNFFVLFLMSGLISGGCSKPQNPNPDFKDLDNMLRIFGRRTSTDSESAESLEIGQVNQEADLDSDFDVEAVAVEAGEVDFDGILERLFNEVDKYISEKGKEITSKISSEISQLGQNIGAQISALHSNGSVEMNSLGDKLEKEISSLKEQMKTQFLNSKASDADSAPPPPPPSTPRFYMDDQYNGDWFSPAPGWETKCTEMPGYMDHQASSVKLGGHCLLVCPAANCQDSIFYFPGNKCIEIHPNSFGLDNLKKLQFNDQIRSFRPCQKK